MTPTHHPNHHTYRLQAGFTFIELLLYVALVGIVLAAVVQFLGQSQILTVKNNVRNDVGTTARFLSQKMEREMRDATSIDEGSSTFGSSLTSGGSFILNAPSPKNSVVFTVSSGVLHVSINGGAAVPLHDPDIQVTDLTFQNYSAGDDSSDHAIYTLTLTSNNPGDRQEYDASLSLTGGAEVRSH